MFENFKNVIRKGDKFIFVEDGKPSYVVMHYDDYEMMLARRSLDEGGLSRKPADIGAPRTAEALRAEQYAQKSQPTFADASAGRSDFAAGLVRDYSNLPEDISKIRLEDLPL